MANLMLWSLKQLFSPWPVLAVILCRSWCTWLNFHLITMSWPSLFFCDPCQKGEIACLPVLLLKSCNVLKISNAGNVPGFLKPSLLTLPFCFLVKAGAKVIFCGREGMSIFLILLHVKAHNCLEQINTLVHYTFWFCVVLSQEKIKDSRFWIF